MQSGCGRRERSDRATAASILLDARRWGWPPSLAKTRSRAASAAGWRNWPRRRPKDAFARRIVTGWPSRAGSGRSLEPGQALGRTGQNPTLEKSLRADSCYRGGSKKGVCCRPAPQTGDMLRDKPT